MAARLSRPSPLASSPKRQQGGLWACLARPARHPRPRPASSTTSRSIRPGTAAPRPSPWRPPAHDGHRAGHPRQQLPAHHHHITDTRTRPTWIPPRMRRGAVPDGSRRFPMGFRRLRALKPLQTLAGSRSSRWFPMEIVKSEDTLCFGGEHPTGRTTGGPPGIFTLGGTSRQLSADRCRCLV